MKFRFIWIGSNADAEYRVAIDRYLARIRHFYPVEVLEVAAEKDRQRKKDVAIMHAESARLVAAVPGRGAAVVLDATGEMMDSLQFSSWLERMTMTSPQGVNFILGGDVGFDDSVRKRADKLLSLSRMTLPHELARVVLVEQVYRACTVMRNIRYHK